MPLTSSFYSFQHLGPSLDHPGNSKRSYTGCCCRFGPEVVLAHKQTSVGFRICGAHASSPGASVSLKKFATKQIVY